MEFARPEFLWALPAAALPTLIHLLNRRRFRVVDFAAMAFLRVAVRRVRRRLLLEDLLLLLLRTLAILLLVLAFAHPQSRGQLPVGAARRPEGVVLLLDASLSMEHRVAGNSAWELARDRALERLERLDGEGGDQAAVVLAGLEPSLLSLGKPEAAHAALREREVPDASNTDLAAALLIATEAADSLAAATQGVVDILLLGDLQAATWGPPGVHEALEKASAAGHRLTLGSVGDPSRTNTAVAAIMLEPTVVAPGEPVQVTVRIRQFGAERAALGGVLLIDDVERESFSFTPLPLGESTWTTLLHFAEPGVFAVGAELDADAQRTDDRRHAIVRVRPAPDTALIGEAQDRSGAERVGGTLIRMLDTKGSGAPLHLRTIPSAATDAQSLAKAEVVVVADPEALSARAQEAIVARHRAGAGLLLAIGPRWPLGLLGTLLPGSGMELGRAPTDHPDGAGRLQITAPEHPALRLFADPRWQPLLTEIPLLHHRRLADSGDAETLLTFLDGTGALLSFPSENGRALILLAPPDPLWNRFPSVPAGALPLLYDAIGWLAPSPGHNTTLPVGEALAVEWPTAPTSVRLLAPDGTPSGIAAPPHTLPGGRAGQRLRERVRHPGVWEATAALVGESGATIDLTERFAVQPPFAESDPASADPALLGEALPLGGIQEEASLATAPQTARPWERLAYLGVLLLLGGELMLGAFLDRRRDG